MVRWNGRQRHVLQTTVEQICMCGAGATLVHCFRCFLILIVLNLGQFPTLELEQWSGKLSRIVRALLH